MTWSWTGQRWSPWNLDLNVLVLLLSYSVVPFLDILRSVVADSVYFYSIFSLLQNILVRTQELAEWEKESEREEAFVECPVSCLAVFCLYSERYALHAEIICP